MHFSPQGGSPSVKTKSIKLFRCCSRAEMVLGDWWLSDVEGRGFRYAEMRCRRKN